MQYIQLQGQVASQLDLPLEGSYNLFIDTSDNSIKAKDFEGNLTGGGGGLSLIETTREAVGQLVLSASLTPGAFYKITGAASQSFLDALSIGYTGAGNEIQDGGTTIILQATTDKTLSKKGIGLFYVPNYEDINNPTVAPDYNYEVWDPTSRLYFTNLSGLFDHDEAVTLYSNGEDTQTDAYIVANTGNNSLTIVYDSNTDKFLNYSSNYNGLTITGNSTHVSASITGCDYTSSYNVGDKVIWGGRVWTNRSGSIGYSTGAWPNAQLNLNAVDWTKVAFNETDYTIVADLIEYEFEVDNISYRKGANNVEVTSIFKIWDDNWGYNMIKYFPWGHPNIQNISISNSYLDAFVNYPHDSYAGQIKFADFGGFNAHYWGHSTEIYGIDGNNGAHMVSLNLGYNTNISNIKLGIESRIADIHTYDSDSGTVALSNITLGNNAEISSNASDPIYMYNASFMENLELDTNSHISDINLYPHSRIKDSKLGIWSYIESIGLGNESDFRQVEIGNGSYVQYMNTDVSSCFKRIKLGIDCNISGIGIGTNGYVKHIEIGDQSSIYCNLTGDNAYFQYINLGINSHIYSIDQTAGNSNFEYIQVGVDSNIHNITLGVDCSFNHITLGSDSSINGINAGGATNAYIRHIDVKNTSYFGSISMADGSYIRRMDIGSDVEVGGISLTGGTSISDFQLATTSGVGSIDLLASSSLSNFEIGQGWGFGGMDVTSSMSYVTIGRGFSNFNANVPIAGTTGSLNWNSSMTDLDAGSNSFFILDTTGWNASNAQLNYRLPDGDYDGQTVKFFHTNGGTDLGGTYIGNLLIWGYLTDTDSFDTAGHYPWSPFMKSDNSGHRVDVPTAIWIGGKWIIDNSIYD